MPVGRDYFIGFNEHPTLFEFFFGKVILSRPEFEHYQTKRRAPPLALDVLRRRFAVTDTKGIPVIQPG
jgi:hypothetical protein